MQQSTNDFKNFYMERHNMNDWAHYGEDINSVASRVFDTASEYINNKPENKND